MATPGVIHQTSGMNGEHSGVCGCAVADPFELDRRTLKAESDL